MNIIFSLLSLQSIYIYIYIYRTDIRVYDARNGELLKVFSDVLDDRGSSDLTSFCLDDRHRKCFVGDTSVCTYILTLYIYIFCLSIYILEYRVQSEFTT